MASRGTILRGGRMAASGGLPGMGKPGKCQEEPGKLPGKGEAGKMPGSTRQAARAREAGETPGSISQAASDGEEGETLGNAGKHLPWRWRYTPALVHTYESKQVGGSHGMVVGKVWEARQPEQCGPMSTCRTRLTGHAPLSIIHLFGFPWHPSWQSSEGAARNPRACTWSV